MVKQVLPNRVDPWQFASKGKQLAGKVAIDNMTRLHQSLVQPQGGVDVSLHFGIDAKGIHYIKGHITTTLILECQRCLLAMPWFVDINLLLAIMTSDRQSNEDDFDTPYDIYIVEKANENLSLLDLVEDELILALPIVSKHDYPCSDFLKKNVVNMTSTQRHSKQVHPFAILKDYKIK